MTKKIQINSLLDTHKALAEDTITPGQAITICCRALKMLDTTFREDSLSKEEVLTQILKLDNLIKEYDTVPLFFFDLPLEVYTGKE